MTIVRIILTILSTVRAPAIRTTLPRVFHSRNRSIVHHTVTIIGMIGRADALIPTILNNILCTTINTVPVVRVAVIKFNTTTIIRYFVQLNTPSHNSINHIATISSLHTTKHFLAHRRPRILRLILVYTTLGFLIAKCTRINFPCVIQAMLKFNSATCNLTCNLIKTSKLLNTLTNKQITESLSVQQFPVTVTTFSLAVLPRTLTVAVPTNKIVQLAILATDAYKAVVTVALAGLVTIPTVRVNYPRGVANGIVSLTLSTDVYTRPLKRVTCN